MDGDSLEDNGEEEKVPNISRTRVGEIDKSSMGD